MGYNGLSSDMRTRRDQDKAPGGQGAARSASPGGASSQDWNDDAQDQISALLGQVEDEAEEDLLDLAAIREALARKQQQPEPEEKPEAQEPPKEARKRLEWLDKLLGADRSPAEEEAPAPAPDAPPKAEAPAKAPQAAAMDHLFKDVVMMDLLQRGVLTLPQALRVVEQQAQQPEQVLWRLVAQLPGVDRDLVFDTAANLLGFPAVDLAAEDTSAAMLGNVMRLLPAALREQLFALNLLPFKLSADRKSRKHTLLFASHDPAHPDVRQLVEALGMQAELYYAPEAAVARCLEDARTTAQEPEAPAEAVTPAEAEAPQAVEILDLSADDEFLELHWEPFSDEEEAAAEAAEEAVEAAAEEVAEAAAEAAAEAVEEAAEEAAEAAAEEVEWKSLAELEAAAPAADLDDLDRDDAQRNRPAVSRPAAGASSDEAAEGADMPPADEVLLDAPPADAPADAPAPPAEIPSFDGSTVDLPEQTPVPDVADWTQADEPPPAEPKPAAPPPAKPEPAAQEENDSRYDRLPDVDLEKIKSKDRVVAMLMRKGIVSPRQIKRAHWKQDEDNLKDPLWRVLTTVEGAPRNAIFAEAASVYAFKTAEMGEGKPDPEFARSVMDTFDEGLRDTLLKLRAVPFEVDLDQQTGAIKVVFITHDPTRPEVHRTMQKLKLERFELRYAPEAIVTGLILEAFPRRNEFLERIAENDAFDLGMSYEEKSELVDEDALEAEINRSKLINLFEATLIEAVRQGASDVHIWPNAKKQVEIHFRVDGRLQRWHLEDKIHPEALIAVIKDNAMNVDRFERDAAQDGFIQRWIDEALIRFRVSVLPIANAATDVRSESIVIRVLDDRKVIKDLRKLGLHEVAYQRFTKAIRQPHGMVILTGPTGSGKTTTLYASLHEVVSPEVNVLTVEDPVEYILPGVRQIKLNHKLGLEGALRSILRHDPDIVMVGEMRDRDTAELAIKLANTGHLTFSTLHTNDAASAVTRLYKMDIEPFLIAYAINLVVAQRLIRRLCQQCKRVDPDPDPVLLKNLGFSEEEIDSMTFYIEGHDQNCPTCKGLGYKGRRAVTEALYFSRAVRHLIADSEGKLDEQEIKALGIKEGMMTLQDSAREIVKQGDTSILEMLRVIAAED